MVCGTVPPITPEVPTAVAASTPAAHDLSGLFASAMEALGPFEPAPHLAVAVSGGADSMVLSLLAADWARARGGTVTALTVDHRLRAESRREALWVRRALAARKISHRILTWRAGAKMTGANLQARAREARYGLLEDWCRAKGVLHLLAAHHQDDQAETFVMRLARGSGYYGLAAMAPVVERAGMRLLRPLLDVPRDELRSFLEDEGADWIEDPSNENTIFTRVRVRRAMPGLAAAGVGAARIAETAIRLGRDRLAMDHGVAKLLARAAAPDPAGFIHVKREALLDAPAAVGLRALARLIVTVGGAPYPPRFVRLRRLYDEIAGPCRTRTLGGACIRKGPGAVLLLCRELAALAEPLEIKGPATVRWDGRFLVRLAPAKGGGGPASMTLGALGGDGWKEIKADQGGFGVGRRSARPGLPAMVRASVPALRDRRGVLEVPHLGYRRCLGGIASLRIAEIRPFPPQPLSGGVFGVTGVDSGG